MQVSVRSKNLELTAALREYTEKKVNKLEKYFEGLEKADAIATLSVERGRHIVDVTISLGHVLLRAEERSSDMYASIDLVAEKLEKQVIRYKDRVQRKREHQAAVAAGVATSDEWGAQDRPRIVRSKAFEFKPMDVEEAILQMDLLGHDFFVFVNAKTEKVNVVYKRKNADYGLIEPNY